MRTLFLVMALLVVTAALAQENRAGCVLKVGEGEYATGAIIKASPESGAQGGVLLYEPFPDGFSTRLRSVTARSTGRSNS